MKGAVLLKLNESDIQPLYQQLAENLRRKIREGVYPEGSQLPTEKALSMEYDVSRITVRNALKLLMEEGLVSSKQGKGTFVYSSKVERNISVPSSFNQFCAENGYTPTTKIIYSGYRPPSKEDEEILHTEEDELVVVIERLLCMDDTPVIFESFHFRQRYSFLLSEELNNTSILRILNEKYGFTFDDLHRSVELVFASKEVAKLLQVKTGYPLLLLDSHVESRSSHDRNRSIQYVLGDKFKLEF